jgi:hypothetical protein
MIQDLQIYNFESFFGGGQGVKIHHQPSRYIDLSIFIIDITFQAKHIVYPQVFSLLKKLPTLINIVKN